MKNLLRGVLFLSFILFSATAKLSAQTNVSGGIYANTTWTLAGSPYTVTDTVVVFPGVTLTIQPGVTVKMDAQVMITVRGDLVCSGTATDSIHFISSAVNPAANDWVGIVNDNTLGGTSTFDYVVFEHAHSAVNSVCCLGTGNLTISHSSFKFNEVAVGDYPGYPNMNVMISHCYFAYNTYAITKADKTISYCLFEHNVYGLYNTERINVLHCTFCANFTALDGGRGDLQFNTIVYNGTGVRAFYEGFFNVHDNVIAYNDTGIVLGEYNTSCPGLGSNNKICGNTIYDLINNTSLNVAIPNNCWCTSTSSVISMVIYDGYDNVNLGLINFTPFMACDSSDFPAHTCPGSTTTFPDEVESSVLQDGLQLFPNPTNGSTTISSERAMKDVTIIVSDMLGNTVQQMNNLSGTQFIIPRLSMSEGVYIVRMFENETPVSTFKLMISE